MVNGPADGEIHSKVCRCRESNSRCTLSLAQRARCLSELTWWRVDSHESKWSTNCENTQQTARIHFEHVLVIAERKTVNSATQKPLQLFECRCWYNSNYDFAIRPYLKVPLQLTTITRLIFLAHRKISTSRSNSNSTRCEANDLVWVIPRTHPLFLPLSFTQMCGLVAEAVRSIRAPASCI